MPREKTPEQIPWAERTAVTHLSDTSAWFEQTGTRHAGKKWKQTAEVFLRNFEWSVTLDSRVDILDYMSLDERMTQDLREFWDEDEEKHYTSTYRDRITRWLRGQGGRAHKIGPKEWRPRKVRGPVGKLTNSYGYGNTYNEDPVHWWGDVFEFAHFNTEDGDEAAVILWNKGGSPSENYTLPEVWTGNFEDFMLSQSEYEPNSYETFLRWNEIFENAFMWAWEKMGVFDDWDDHISDVSHRQIHGVLQAIEKDPSILLPESVEKILENGLDYYPKQLRKAVTWLMTNKRRELEKALGQKLIWEDLYGA